MQEERKIEITLINKFFNKECTQLEQETKLTIDLQNVTIETMIDKIEKESDFFFMFNQKLVDVERRVSVKVTDTMIKNIL